MTEKLEGFVRADTLLARSYITVLTRLSKTSVRKDSTPMCVCASPEEESSSEASSGSFEPSRQEGVPVR